MWDKNQISRNIIFTHVSRYLLQLSARLEEVYLQNVFFLLNLYHFQIVRKLLKEILTPEAIDTFLFLRYELHYKLSDCFEAVESSDGDALAAMGFFQECSICYEVTIMSKVSTFVSYLSENVGELLNNSMNNVFF